MEGDLAFYYVLNPRLWGCSITWGARALIALALEFLYPWIDIYYSDTDCGPGC